MTKEISKLKLLLYYNVLLELDLMKCPHCNQIIFKELLHPDGTSCCWCHENVCFDDNGLLHFEDVPKLRIVK